MQNAQEPVTRTEPEKNGAIGTEPISKNEKLFTQEEVNALVLKAENKVNKKYEGINLEDYRKWEESTKTDSQKLSDLEAHNSKLSKEVEHLKAELVVSKSGVKPEFLKFVTSEVMSLINDKTDVETALKAYKKENSQYFGETVIKKVQSSPNLGGGAKPTTTSDIMNGLLRGAVNKN